MDDKSKANGSNVADGSDDQSQNQPQAQPVVPPAPATPKLKEQGPSFAKAPAGEADRIAKEEGDEYWENYSREIELEKEILEMGGVEKIESGEVAVPKDLAKEMGIKPAVTEQTAVSSQTGFSIGGVAYDDNQLSAGLTKPTSSGLRWVVEWFIYQLLKAHFHIKRVKNKIIRTK